MNKLSLIGSLTFMALLVSGCGKPYDGISRPETPSSSKSTTESTDTKPQDNTPPSSDTKKDSPTSTQITSFPSSEDYLSQGEVAQVIKAQTRLPDDQVAGIIETLKGQSSDRSLLVNSVMTSSRFSAGFCWNSSHWSPSFSFKDSSTGAVVTLSDLYDIYFEDGGLKLSLCYKWLIMFLVGTPLDVQSLDGAVYGRGLGAALNLYFPFSIESDVLPGNNRPGFISVVAPSFGLNSGLSLPRMTFKKRQLVP